MPRLRQAVLAARDLDATVARLRAELGLGEPYADPDVAYFGLRNAVFAVGDTFLEVVSPVRRDTAAGRFLDGRGEDEAGYMVMVQTDDLAAARGRAAAEGVREVFQVEFDDIAEVHLHPADLHGAIVSLSVPSPPQAWRWAGSGWHERAVPGAVTGATLAVADPVGVAALWETVLGGLPAGISFTQDASEPGVVAIEIERDGRCYAL
jgi:hypothetical protein